MPALVLSQSCVPLLLLLFCGGFLLVLSIPDFVTSKVLKGNQLLVNVAIGPGTSVVIDHISIELVADASPLMIKNNAINAILSILQSHPNGSIASILGILDPGLGHRYLTSSATVLSPKLRSLRTLTVLPSLSKKDFSVPPQDCGLDSANEH